MKKRLGNVFAVMLAIMLLLSMNPTMAGVVDEYGNPVNTDINSFDIVEGMEGAGGEGTAGEQTGMEGAGGEDWAGDQTSVEGTGGEDWTGDPAGMEGAGGEVEAVAPAAVEGAGAEGTAGEQTGMEGAGDEAVAGDPAGMEGAGGEVGTADPAVVTEGTENPEALPENTGTPAAELFKVNETVYADLTNAFHAVAEAAGDKVTLLADVTLANPVELRLPEGKSVTLDLDGHKLQLVGDRGTLEGDASGAAENTGKGGMFILHSGAMTITDSSEEHLGVIDNTSSPNPVFKLIQSSESTVSVSLSVENGTFKTGPQGLVALEDETGSTIETPDETTVTIEIRGGNFDQEVSQDLLAEGYVLSQKEDMTYEVKEAAEAENPIEGENPEGGEQAEQVEQVEPVEPVEPVQPEGGEQVEPVEPVEPVQPEGAEQAEQVEQVEPVQPEGGEQAEQVEQVEPVEPVEPVQPEGGEQVEQVEPVEPVEPVQPEDGEQVPATTYIVTFDSAAEDVAAPAAQTVAEGQLAADPGDLARSGYSFAGWFLDGEDARFDFAARPIGADIVLRARWTQNLYTVTFDLHHEGAVGQPDVQQVSAGAAAAKPADPSASDALFGYWTAQEDSGDGTASAEYDFSAPVSSDLTLHGYWTALPDYAIAFEPGEGSGEMPPVTVAAGSQYTLPTSTFAAPEGKRFVSWDRGAVGDAITIDGDTVLIAQWENIPVYTISFYSNGGSGDMRPVTMYEGSSFVLPQSAFTPPAGKVFAGWDKGTAGTTLMVSADLAINAIWADAPVVSYTISFDPNGGTGAMEPLTVKQGQTLVLPDCTFEAPEGQVFTGWDKGTPGSVITVGENTVLRAMWTAQETQPAVYSVTFYTERGNIPVGQLVEAGQKAVKPDDPTAPDFNFLGWYTELEMVNSFDFNTPIDRNMTLYAKWEQVQTPIQFFTVAFYTEHGPVPAQQSVERGAVAAKPADPPAQGYLFGGWYTEKECKNLYDFNTPVTANLNLFAKWAETPSQSCVVYFHSNGHGNTPNPQPVMTGQLVQKPADPTATGYTFTGWFLDTAGNEAFNFQAPVTGDVTLYAGWTPNRYTVRFDSNEGVGTMSSLSCVYGTRSTLPADTFTRSGYTFAGWNTEKDGTGVNYTDQAIVLNLTNSNGGVVPLYAQWKNLYNVIEGGNAVIPRSGATGFTFRVDGDYTKFTGISIDGRNVSSNQYTSWAGSTFVRLDRDYVNQMTEGDHTVKFMYTDGSVETNVNITSAAPASTVRPHNIVLWIIIIIILLAIVVMTMIIVYMRRRNAE